MLNMPLWAAQCHVGVLLHENCAHEQGSRLGRLVPLQFHN